MTLLNFILSKHQELSLSFFFPLSLWTHGTAHRQYADTIRSFFPISFQRSPYTTLICFSQPPPPPSPISSATRLSQEVVAWVLHDGTDIVLQRGLRGGWWQALFTEDMGTETGRETFPFPWTCKMPHQWGGKGCKLRLAAAVAPQGGDKWPVEGGQGGGARGEDMIRQTEGEEKIHFSVVKKKKQRGQRSGDILMTKKGSETQHGSVYAN